MGDEVGAVTGEAAGADGVGDGLSTAVEDTVRAVVEAEVVPRWGRLAAADIERKTGPYDLVTTADKLAEERLTERLTALLPGSVAVGEEAVSADPAVLERLHGAAPVWVIDPVDGTAAFVRGEDGFATLVALVIDGEPVASWTYAPRLGLFATARRGRGAYLGGGRLRTRDSGEPLRLWTSNPVFRNPGEREALARLEDSGAECTPCACAGLAYLDVARGEMDGVAFFWEAPWDHAAGLLLVTEAGGASLTAAGTPFRIPGGNTLPFTVARDTATAERVAGLMAADARGADPAIADPATGGSASPDPATADPAAGGPVPPDPTTAAPKADGR